MKSLFILALSLAAQSTLHAGPRSSASYSIATEVLDGAGKRTASVSYSNDGSLGGITGISTAASPAATAKQGYIGQLYEVSALLLAATGSTINEGGTKQINGSQWLDDLTFLAVPADSIAWSVLNGPVSIGATGLATTAAVYQNTEATVQANFEGMTGTLGLTVLDTIPDNFGSYAGDRIGDGWQVHFFGIDNPNAGPSVDLDRDGLSNLMEFAGALNPTLPGPFQTPLSKSGSVLELTYSRATEALSGGILFTVEWSDTLPGPNPWSTAGVTETILSDNGSVQQVKATVPAGSFGRRFMRLRVVAQ